MKYYTVSEISDQVGKENIHEVTQRNKSVSIQLKGSLISRVCTLAECLKVNGQAREHASAGVRPRLTIRSY